MSLSARRFLFFLFAASLIHLLLIWGMGFNFVGRLNQYFPTLDITLTPPSDDEVEQANFLSQFSSLGSGEQVKKSESQQQLRAAGGSTQQAEKQANVGPSTEKKAEQQKEAERSLPGLSRLLSSSQDVIQLGMDKQQLGSRDRLRHQYVSARSKKYLYASYIEGWQYKVERTGNINFPQEAKKRHISGELVLDVGINQDGSIHSIKVRRSSGHDILDKAAMRIVKMSAPFAPLPTDIKKETDVLHIVRTWQFQSSDRQLKTRGR